MPWTVQDIPDQSGRVAVVTGANSGIGLETARALAERGGHVVMACRNPTKGAAALAELKAEMPGASVEVMALDLADLSSVRSFAAAFDAAHPRLDLLVNNAGVMMTPDSKTADGFEMQFGTNHLGHYALTGLLLDRLLAAKGPRVVNVSSNAHKAGKIDFDNLDASAGYSKIGAYCQSKLANLLFGRELQRRLTEGGHDVVVASAHPGWAATNLMEGGPIALATKLLAQSSLAGALPSLYAATAPDVRPLDYIGPGWFDMIGSPKKTGSRPAAKDDATARRLWAVSTELTGVSYL